MKNLLFALSSLYRALRDLHSISIFIELTSGLYSIDVVAAAVVVSIYCTSVHTTTAILLFINMIFVSRGSWLIAHFLIKSKMSFYSEMFLSEKLSSWHLTVHTISHRSTPLPRLPYGLHHSYCHASPHLHTHTHTPAVTEHNPPRTV